MPEVFRAFGLIFVIYPDDHAPPHVHVEHGGEKAKIFLDGPRIDDRSRCTLSVANLRKALRLAAENRMRLLDEWEKFHGQER